MEIERAAEGGPPCIASDLGLSLPEFAVAWALAHPAVQAAIVGARRPSHLDGTVRAADVMLSQVDLDRIAAVMKDAVPVGPTTEGM